VRITWQSVVLVLPHLSADGRYAFSVPVHRHLWSRWQSVSFKSVNYYSWCLRFRFTSPSLKTRWWVLLENVANLVQKSMKEVMAYLVEELWLFFLCSMLFSDVLRIIVPNNTIFISAFRLTLCSCLKPHCGSCQWLFSIVCYLWCIFQTAKVSFSCMYAFKSAMRSSWCVWLTDHRKKSSRSSGSPGVHEARLVFAVADLEREQRGRPCFKLSESCNRIPNQAVLVI
jgi:hypothetical protein